MQRRCKIYEACWRQDKLTKLLECLSEVNQGHHSWVHGPCYCYDCWKPSSQTYNGWVPRTPMDAWWCSISRGIWLALRLIHLTGRSGKKWWAKRKWNRFPDPICWAQSSWRWRRRPTVQRWVLREPHFQTARQVLAHRQILCRQYNASRCHVSALRAHIWQRLSAEGF